MPLSAVPEEDLAMLATMKPELQPGTFIYCTTTNELATELLPRAKALFLESEGWTLILPTEVAKENGFDVGMPIVQLSLSSSPALHGAGIAAAVMGAFAEYKIPCNFTSAFHHDYLFLPFYFRAKAMRIIQDLQVQAQELRDKPKQEAKVDENIKQK